jgi:transcriptional regulator with XRE-family HTH domain
MSTINDRIVELIDEFGIKKIQFAERLGISSAYASQLCSGVRTPSDRTIADICREFHVRREWLETGEGPIKLPEPEEDLDYINILVAQSNNPMKDLVRAILVAFDRATPQGKQAILDYIQQVKKELGSQ